MVTKIFLKINQQISHPK